MKDKICTRRDFIKGSTVTVAGLALAPKFFSKLEAASIPSVNTGSPDPVETNSSVDIIYSVCLMCHSACGIQGKVKDDILLKVDGNPYHPNCMEPNERLPYYTSPKAAKLIPGRNCVKSQAAPQTLYDPYLLLNPLKRVGARGSGQWEEISWKQALDEIAAKLAPYYNTQTNINSAFPEFGKVSNQIVFSAGRIEHGQKEYTDRIFKNGIGTANYRHDHTSICELSHHTGGDLISDFKKHHWKPDIVNSKYLVWFGTSPLEAGFPMQALARKVSTFLKRGGMMVTVDPRFSNTAAKSRRWVPVKSGTDGAFALGMQRYIIANKLYDKNFLTNTRSQVNGELSYSDATFLVRENNGTFMRDGAGKNMVWNSGQAFAADAAPGDKGELDPGIVSVGGVPCRTVWALYKDRVFEKTVGEYASICGISTSYIIDTAIEFANSGKRAVANPYRGTVQHTNGTHAFMAVAALNALVGNYDWKGGNTTGGSHWHEEGGKATGQVSLKNVPNGVSPSGVPISRHGKNYEKDAPNLFKRDGYPAKRPWSPMNVRWNYQEILPSIADGYPYPIKALILYWNDILYSTPAAKEVGAQILKNTSKIPTLIAFDIIMGETSIYADYVLPDTTWLERFSTPHVSPAIVTTTSGYRQPLVGTFEKATVGGKNRSFYVSPRATGNVARDFWQGTNTASGPQLLEDIMIALGGRLGIPGVGANAFDTSGAAAGYKWSSGLYSATDWYQNILNNFAIEAGVTVDDIVNKGGVFAPISGEPANSSESYSGNYIKKTYKGIHHFYVEGLKTTKDSMTGKTYDPLPAHIPIQDAMGKNLKVSASFPYELITYKNVYHAQARTICNPWLQLIKPTNFLDINRGDARALGLETGDMVRIINPDGARAEGMVFATECIRPGVVAIAHSYGHWEMGSKPVYGGDYDPARGLGIAQSPLNMLDPKLKNVSLQDTLGGSVSFGDTRVRVVKL
jgi:anaerobic selenocysteine-containing dehydrogenase